VLAPPEVTLEDMRMARAALVAAFQHGRLHEAGPAIMVLRRWLEQQGMPQNGHKRPGWRGQVPSPETRAALREYQARRRRMW
jgi:hypothetical protein